ncbi:hypothetical protein C8J56DRAFT_78057 [Mycena floridula]|nr:hypothetical protein C8J56DRAFT_78057 [Mycena floridula]
MTILPVELYRPIAEVVEDRPALVALCLTTKTLGHEAERILYRHFTGRKTLSQMLFFKTVISSRRLALLVQSVDIHLYRPSNDEIWSLLAEALAALVNLQRFDFSANAHVVRNPIAHILDNCTFRLTYFSWNFASPDEQKLALFLQAQTSLRTLRLDWNGLQSPDPHHTMLPGLTNLSGNYGIIQALLPMRNITELHWMSNALDRDPTDDELVQLSSSFSKIRSLTLRTYSSNVLFRSASSFTNLEQLHFSEYSGFLRIPTIPSLLHLTVSSQWEEPNLKEDFVDNLFARMPELRDVGVQFMGDRRTLPTPRRVHWNRVQWLSALKPVETATL